MVGLLLAILMELGMTRRWRFLISYADKLVCTNGYSIGKQLLKYPSKNPSPGTPEENIVGVILGKGPWTLSAFCVCIRILWRLFAFCGNYCSRFQTELTSTWNHYTPRTTGNARTETFSILASGRQNGGHKITTQPKTSMVLFYIGSYLLLFKVPKTALDPEDDKKTPFPNTMMPKEIVLKFANSLEQFDPIDRQPSGTDLTRA